MLNTCVQKARKIGSKIARESRQNRRREIGQDKTGRRLESRGRKVTQIKFYPGVQEARKLLESAKEKLEMTVQRDPYRNSAIPKVSSIRTVHCVAS